VQIINEPSSLSEQLVEITGYDHSQHSRLEGHLIGRMLYGVRPKTLLHDRDHASAQVQSRSV